MICGMMNRASHRVEAVEAALCRRLRSGCYHPGDRFMSNRAIAGQYGISYQTAHRVVQRLAQRGVLERHPRSGTYVPGPAQRPTHVQLIFHPRARVRGSFGAKLLAAIREQLVGAGFDEPRLSFGDAPLCPEALPVLWEADESLQRCVRESRRAIMINDRPAPGLDAMRIDSVGTDDFVGGVLAAQYVGRLLGDAARCAILAGPKTDRRSRLRVAGFQSERATTVTHARSWYATDAEAVAGRLLRAEPDAVFCANDRLAQGMLRVASRRGLPLPAIVGYDDAPIAQELRLTTVAIPWAALAAGLARLVRDRLAGATDPATHLVYYPTLVLRHEKPSLDPPLPGKTTRPSPPSTNS